jgi:hypothetical protein
VAFVGIRITPAKSNDLMIAKNQEVVETKVAPVGGSEESWKLIGPQWPSVR